MRRRIPVHRGAGCPELRDSVGDVLPRGLVLVVDVDRPEQEERPVGRNGEVHQGDSVAGVVLDLFFLNDQTSFSIGIQHSSIDSRTGEYSIATPQTFLLVMACVVLSRHAPAENDRVSTTTGQPQVAACASISLPVSSVPPGSPPVSWYPIAAVGALPVMCLNSAQLAYEPGLSSVKRSAPPTPCM